MQKEGYERPCPALPCSCLPASPSPSPPPSLPPILPHPDWLAPHPEPLTNPGRRRRLKTAGRGPAPSNRSWLTSSRRSTATATAPSASASSPNKEVSHLSFTQVCNSPKGQFLVCHLPHDGGSPWPFAKKAVSLSFVRCLSQHTMSLSKRIVETNK